MSRMIVLNGARAPFLKIANAAFSGSWQVISDATICIVPEVLKDLPFGQR
jgi:hypothetical protein